MPAPTSATTASPATAESSTTPFWLDLTTQATSWLAEGQEKVVRNLTEQVLGGVGEGMLRGIQDPYQPGLVKRLVADAFNRIWGEVKADIHRDVQRSYGWADIHYAARKQRLEKWRDAPSLCKCCDIGHFFRALRARFLYADQPADGTPWKVLWTDPLEGRPLGLVVFALKMYIPTSGTHRRGALHELPRIFMSSNGLP